MLAAGPALRDKQAAATQEHLLEAAFTLLVDHPERPFSHEAVAKAARVGARTVYRYFPAQADLFEALWVRVRAAGWHRFPGHRSADSAADRRAVPGLRSE